MKNALYILLLLVSGHSFSYTDISEEKRSFYDRHVLRNIVLEALGDNAVKAFDKTVMKNGLVFGGPCDLYSQVFVGQDKVVDQKSKCHNAKASVADPYFGVGGNIRTKYMVDFCSEISTSKKILDSIYELNKGKDSKEDLKNLFAGFYRHKNSKVIYKKILAQKDKTKKETRKDMFQRNLIALCLTEEWQLI